jgi:hypothetical protein
MATDRRFTGGATGRSADETGRPGDPSAGPDGPDRPAEEGVGSVRVDGRRLAYATYGDPDGRPVLVHHGSPGSRLVGQLLDGAARERGLRLVAPDRPGFGRSTHDPDRTIPDWPGDAAAVLDALGIERASVVASPAAGRSRSRSRPRTRTGSERVGCNSFPVFDGAVVESPGNRYNRPYDGGSNRRGRRTGPPGPQASTETGPVIPATRPLFSRRREAVGMNDRSPKSFREALATPLGAGLALLSLLVLAYSLLIVQQVLLGLLFVLLIGGAYVAYRFYRALDAIADGLQRLAAVREREATRTTDGTTGREREGGLDRQPTGGDRRDPDRTGDRQSTGGERIRDQVRERRERG